MGHILAALSIPSAAGEHSERDQPMADRVEGGEFEGHGVFLDFLEQRDLTWPSLLLTMALAPRYASGVWRCEPSKIPLGV